MCIKPPNGGKHAHGVFVPGRPATRIEKIKRAIALALLRPAGLLSRWVSYPEHLTINPAVLQAGTPIRSPYLYPDDTVHVSSWEELQDARRQKEKKSAGEDGPDGFI